MGLLDVLKKLSKQEIDLHPFQIFKTTRSVFHSTLAIGNSFESIHRKIIVARYLKYSQSKRKHPPHWFEDLKWLRIDPCFCRLLKKSSKSFSIKFLVRKFTVPKKIVNNNHDVG